MSSTISPQWREKAAGFFSNSGVKIRQAGQTAGSFVGEVARDASVGAADVKERVTSLVKSRWSLIQQNRQRQAEPPKESIQERIISAAASTSVLLKKGISETKEKVVVGKMKVEEAAKKTATRSKSILSNIERWQKGVASTDVFGVPIEMVVQRQQSGRPIPDVLVKCVDYLVISGLHTENLFRSEGNKKVIRQLVSLYNEDPKASLPDGIHPTDVAALVKCYLASLPEPLIAFGLHDDIRKARSSLNDMRDILKRLPNVSYTTLEFVTALLLRVSQKSSVNKMDAHNLSVELAPLIIWREGDGRPQHISYLMRSTSSTTDFASSGAPIDYLSDNEDDAHASSLISLDEGSPPDYSAIEVIQCLIQHHNAVFTDANVTVWR